LTFFLICKKKVPKKKQTSLGSLTASSDFALSAQMKLQKLNAVCLILPKTVELSKISAIFTNSSG